MYHANKCAHAPCSCPVGEGEKYCSVYCQDSGELAELACGCGHRGCTPPATPKAERNQSEK